MEKQQLIDLADPCLYHSKRNGRNQSVTVEKMQGGRKLRVADGGVRNGARHFATR